jgi:Spx/MgsR family transcriptional regulator
LSDLKIYLYSRCSSCQRADAVLAESGIDYERRDFFKERLTADEIRGLLAKIGKGPLDVLSRRSIPYRELDLANRNVTDDELIDLMAKHPALLRRPIVIAGDHSLVGFSQRGLNELLSSKGAN